MINEVNIYKTVNDKQFTKSKFLLSKLLSYVYNTLKKSDYYGATKRFSIVSEAIFYMLSRTKPQFTWVDYSLMLETAYKEKNLFPTYLQAHFEDIKKYYNTCPVVAQNSNEATLIGIVEKLLIKCYDNTNFRMDIEDSGDKGNTVNVEAILHIIGQPMIEYGFLDRIPDMNSVDENVFISYLTQFVNGLSVDKEIIKRITKTIPLPYNSISSSLRNSEAALVKILDDYEVQSFEELVITINSVLKTLNIPIFKNLQEGVKQLIDNQKELTLNNSTLKRDLELKPDMECMLGEIAVQQFQNYNINYIAVNTTNAYQFYLNALETFARCYVLSSNVNFCNSQEELDRCKTDQNYFKSKLNAYVEFSKEETKLKELIEFKNEIFYYMGSQSTNGCIQTLKFIVEIHEVPTLDLVYTETKILYELLGINNGTKNFIQIITTFLTKYSEGTNFTQTMSIVENILSIIGPEKSAIQCSNIVKSLVEICGTGGETVEKILGSVQNMKEVYNKRLPEEDFSIGEISLDLETFIDKNDTENYDYIPGETNHQKLEFVHENLTEPLQELLAPKTDYSDLVKFFKKLKGNKESKLDRVILDTIVENHKQYDSLVQQQQTTVTNLEQQSLQLENCSKNLEDYKMKYEVSIQTNKVYENKIKELERDCSIKTDKARDYDNTVQQLNDLQKEYDILQNKHKLILVELNDLRAKDIRKVAAVKPKKRKLSDPGDVLEESSGKRRE